MSLIDSHCHLNFPEFLPDLESVLARARAVDLSDILIPGINADSWVTARTLQQQVDAPKLHLAIGHHPLFLADELLESESLTDAMKYMESCLAKHDYVAVGEIGLDKTVPVSMVQQQRVLEAQLVLARNARLPVILHVRQAHEPLLQSLKRFPPLSGGVVHAFTGSEELATRYLDLGLSLGVGGAITYPRARKTRNTFKRLPIAHMVLETDAPGMPINGRQGQRNEPGFLPEIAQSLAELKGIDLAQVIVRCEKNSTEIFGFGR